MTGFARTSGNDEGLTWSWEIKSVNGRGLDLRVRVPTLIDGLDIKARDILKAKFRRGTIFANLTFSGETSESDLQVNQSNLDLVLGLAEELAAREHLAPARIDGLLALKGVLESRPETAGNDEALEAALLAGLTKAADALTDARRREGAQLYQSVTAHMKGLRKLIGEAAKLAEAQPEALREKLKARVELLLTDPDVLAAERLEQEVALLAQRADVLEELDRLAGHVESAEALIGKGGAIGRQLDFVSQELHREANTLVSKSSDMGLTRTGLDIKALIDQFREQVQNIE